jgi:hypothetical protein
LFRKLKKGRMATKTEYLPIVSKDEGTSTPGGRICFNT